LKYTDPSGEIPALVVAAVIGGIVNVAMNYQNIDNGGQFLSYLAVGAASGIAAMYAGSFATALVGVSGGVIGGAVYGFGAGLVSGIITGGGNTWIQGGGWDDVAKGAVIGGAFGGGIGALSGAVLGGVNALADGKDFWTGKQKMVDIPLQKIDPMPIQNEELGLFRNDTETLEAIRNKSSDVTWELYYKERNYNRFTDSNMSIFSRPQKISYTERLASQTDFYHSFPPEMDRIIIQNGNSLSVGNSSSYMLPGRFGDKYGYFQININDKGVIYHRAFYEYVKHHQMYVKNGNIKLYFFNKK
jgi:hypothetical protein